MGGMTAIAAAGGALCGLGWLVVVAGWQRPAGEPSRTTPHSRFALWLRSFSWQQAAALVAVPVLVLAVTGWPVLAGWALLAVGVLPRLFAGRARAARGLGRLPALAEWTRRLASVLTAGAGLEHAINATALSAP